MVGGGSKRALREDCLSTSRNATLQKQEKNDCRDSHQSRDLVSNEIHIETASVPDIEGC